MMGEYHKIQTLFKRDMETKKGRIMEELTLPEFGYLYWNEWSGTEKIDGTNIRIHWRREGNVFTIGGRTDNSQIPAPLVQKLNEYIAGFDFSLHFTEDAREVTLFGEGFGKGIHKAGKLYNPDGVDFILFDVKVNEWMLRRHGVVDVAAVLGLDVVPEVFHGNLSDAIKLVSTGFLSRFGLFEAEGLVLTPAEPLYNRKGERIITKLKRKDFMGNPDFDLAKLESTV